MQSKIKVGISKCLLGENVRYDGGNSLDSYLRDTLGALIEWIPVCPEAECGMCVPRDAMRLVGTDDDLHLITTNTGSDETERLESWANKRVGELKKEGLCAFVFKTRSPSCGLRDVKVYDDKGEAERKGIGIFARIVVEAFPLIPVEDEERLKDPMVMANFMKRLLLGVATKSNA